MLPVKHHLLMNLSLASVTWNGQEWSHHTDSLFWDDATAGSSLIGSALFICLQDGSSEPYQISSQVPQAYKRVMCCFFGEDITELLQSVVNWNHFQLSTWLASPRWNSVIPTYGLLTVYRKPRLIEKRGKRFLIMTISSSIPSKNKKTQGRFISWGKDNPKKRRKISGK